ncbi:hypothetical protein CMV_010950 [Castanea mollissima]|uniref:Uncharacterized protein n=1 Tax=Castanea mollissima TaxID=60419 RepID=A0A8J4VXC5_9ROSI|nr:hypothetical protein CMV_010950 [Castanea mollissima]
MVQNLVYAQNWLQAHVPTSFRKSKDEVEALEDEFHELVLNQATTAASSSSCSSKGEKKQSSRFFSFIPGVFWISRGGLGRWFV